MTVALALAMALLQGAAATLPPSGVRVGASVSPAEVRVGEPVVLVLRLHVAAATRATFPAAVDSTERAEPLDPLVLGDTLRDGIREYTARYRFVAWRPGRLEIPLGPVELEIDGRRQRLDVGAPVLMVTSVLPADTTLRTPRAARGIFTRRGTPWWMWALAPVLLGVAGGLWWWRRRRRMPAVVAVASAEQQATAAFAALDALALPALGESTRHAIAAVAILRAYLGAVHDDASGGLTTAELLARVGRAGADPEARLRALLETVDAVQFAGGQLAPERALALAAEARALCTHYATLRAAARPDA